METIDVRSARRLALARAGLLPRRWSDLPQSARGAGPTARRDALEVMDRFGYLQLDTVSIAGARSHALVLLSRLRGLDPELPETLLRPDEPVFEYWGHEASWIPLDLYPVFGFRRREFQAHPWWGDLVGENPRVANNLLRRIRDEGPLRSVDLEGEGGKGWWNLKLTKKIATALWSSGELAIRERSSFQRSFDLAERVIPEPHLGSDLPIEDALPILLLKALDGHGWATRGTLAATWRLRNLRQEIDSALERLEATGEIVPCQLVRRGERPTAGWIRPVDLELAARLTRIRPRRDEGVLLSPFDPLLWDRGRVRTLFDFDQLLEIFKPAPQRRYGYYCLPVLAGERLVARFDLKAHHRQGILEVLSLHWEDHHPDAATRQAVHHALARHAEALRLTPRPDSPETPKARVVSRKEQ